MKKLDRWAIESLAQGNDTHTETILARMLLDAQREIRSLKEERRCFGQLMRSCNKLNAVLIEEILTRRV